MTAGIAVHHIVVAELSHAIVDDRSLSIISRETALSRHILVDRAESSGGQRLCALCDEFQISGTIILGHPHLTARRIGAQRDIALPENPDILAHNCASDVSVVHEP